MAFPRSATIAAPAVVAVLVLTGCDFPAESRLDFTDTEKVKITEIEIGSGNGDVVVRTTAAAEVRIARVVRYRGDAPGPTYRLDGTKLFVETGCGSMCGVDYDIQAPAGVVVRGGPGSGDITLTDVGGADVRVGSGSITVAGGTGRIAAETGSGDITATDLHGEVRLTSGSGSIEGRGLGGGALSTQANSGDVTLTLDRAGPVRAHADSGDVALTVPPDSYRVRATTGSGDENIGVTDDPNGRHLLEVSTGSGDVTVNAR